MSEFNFKELPNSGSHFYWLKSKDTSSSDPDKKFVYKRESTLVNFFRRTFHWKKVIEQNKETKRNFVRYLINEYGADILKQSIWKDYSKWAGVSTGKYGLTCRDVKRVIEDVEKVSKPIQYYKTEGLPGGFLDLSSWGIIEHTNNLNFSEQILGFLARQKEEDRFCQEQIEEMILLADVLFKTFKEKGGNSGEKLDTLEKQIIQTRKDMKEINRQLYKDNPESPLIDVDALLNNSILLAESFFAWSDCPEELPLSTVEALISKTRKGTSEKLLMSLYHHYIPESLRSGDDTKEKQLEKYRKAFVEKASNDRLDLVTAEILLEYSGLIYQDRKKQQTDTEKERQSSLKTKIEAPIPKTDVSTESSVAYSDDATETNNENSSPVVIDNIRRDSVSSRRRFVVYTIEEPDTDYSMEDVNTESDIEDSDDSTDRDVDTESNVEGSDDSTDRDVDTESNVEDSDDSTDRDVDTESNVEDSDDSTDGDVDTELGVEDTDDTTDSTKKLRNECITSLRHGDSFIREDLMDEYLNLVSEFWMKCDGKVTI